ncbi:MAG TPA: Rne/Rng family ribonuclease [Polyangiaceae bacterium]|jgi:ribonuclease G|nr:Rne/Rng family ribonuclease [Polyangiaceae bacterium]
MARNVLVINVDFRETRVALIEDGVIAELQIERAAHRGTVGNVVLGKVTRVLPGMQAAFIDVGQERAAFLHVEDLIRPADFDAYLSGGARDDKETLSLPDAGARKAGSAEVPAVAAELETSADAETEEEGEDDELALPSSSSRLERDSNALYDESDIEYDDDEADDDDAPVAADDDSDPSHPEVDEDDDEDDEDDDEDDNEEEGDEPAVGAPLGSEPDAATSAEHSSLVAASAAGADALGRPEGASATARVNEGEAGAEVVVAGGGRGRRRRRSGHRSAETGASSESAVDAEAVKAEADDPSGGPQRGSRRRRRRGRRQRGGEVPTASLRPSKAAAVKKTPARVSRAVPITEVVREGDQVVVQISKEPIGTKGARVTSHVSLAGRYVVYLPTVEHVGISKRIGNARERSRLRQTIDALKPPTGGLIVRTVAEGLTKKQLKADVGYLIKVWAEVGKRRQGAKAPTVLYEELDLVLKAARDLFTDEVDHIIIDDQEQYGRLCRFVEMFMPGRVKDIKLYHGQEPIFDEYGIEDEIKRALGRKVPLPSGGSLIVDQAEALTAIDVNTGRYVGKGSKDLEETALKTNLEAVEEIAYQLRFRNIGGLVILDLIDMDRSENRDKVSRTLEQRLAKDKAKTTINRISELGLIEMTRKRTRESLGRIMHEPCFYCDGTGHIMSRETVAHEILRQIHRDRSSLTGYSVKVNAHPAVVDFLKLDGQQALQAAERRYMRRIELVARPEYHLEQYDLQGR